MIIKQNKNLKAWLSNLYYIGTLLTLFFIMAQVILARRAIIQSSEWEKAKLTIENIENFKEKLKETTLYGKAELLLFADGLWPDFSKPENWRKADTLRMLYYTLCIDGPESKTDIENSIAIFNAFAYKIQEKIGERIEKDTKRDRGFQKKQIECV